MTELTHSVEPPVQGTEPAALSRSEKRRVILGVGVGNALEWYDWTAYSIFAAYFAGQFFLATNPLTALLGTLAVFAAGFLMRPLGGLFFGWYADRHGRRRAMTTSMLLTAGGSLLIGVSPTYETIGPAAAVFLLAGRLLQGLGHGGEVVSSFTYVTEMAPASKRGVWASSVFVFVTIGVIAATLLGAGLTSTFGPDAVGEWGWRLPFILGGLLGIYALYLRRSLDETPMFKRQREERAAVAAPRGRGMWAEIWKHRKACLRILILSAGGGVMYYVWAIMAPAFAMGPLKMEPGPVMWVSTGANLFLILCLLFWGRVSDRFGRKLNWIVFGVGSVVMIIPLSMILTGGDGIWRLAVYMGVGMILVAAPTAIMPAYFPEQFPTHVRAVGMGMPYSLGLALTGGTAPYLQAWLYSLGQPRVFDFYLIAVCAIVLTVTLMSPETRGKKLTN
ncbi:MFS transporter [Arthrobacter mangrovi]|uniref:MFS transporter n=1 Tax=Arthrobacter mangrovi TaxID=2966350 RepID=A0ABQ5MYR3_9MICC|nr:MFS transporter [Arthrobacter mangrovi]GLB69132.1 MFS transporter [Arthrobacter mangrovi]